MAADDMKRDPAEQRKDSADSAAERRDSADSAADRGFRCWICLDDQSTTDGMLAPCDCVGTNRWVHEHCLKQFCLEKLAANQQRQTDLSVCCPICRGQYTIERQCAGAAPWRELLRITSTDRQLLLRHCTRSESC